MGLRPRPGQHTHVACLPRPVAIAAVRWCACQWRTGRCAARPPAGPHHPPPGHLVEQQHPRAYGGHGMPGSTGRGHL